MHHDQVGTHVTVGLVIQTRSWSNQWGFFLEQSGKGIHFRPCRLKCYRLQTVCCHFIWHCRLSYVIVFKSKPLQKQMMSSFF